MAGGRTRYLILGGGGMLGADLRAELPDKDVTAPSSSELDVRDAAAVLAVASRHGVKATALGRVRASSGLLEMTIGAQQLRANVAQLADAYHEAIPRIMQRTASAQDVALASDSVV